MSKTIIAWVNGTVQSIEVAETAYAAPEPTIEDRVQALESKTPTISTVTLVADAWEGSTSPYSQTLIIENTTANSMVDLQPTPEQLASWQDEGFAFTTVNDNGTVQIYVTGGLPTEDIAVQVKIQEVLVI